jgi:hypothetical protein
MLPESLSKRPLIDRLLPIVIGSTRPTTAGRLGAASTAASEVQRLFVLEAQGQLIGQGGQATWYSRVMTEVSVSAFAASEIRMRRLGVRVPDPSGRLKSPLRRPFSEFPEKAWKSRITKLTGKYRILRCQSTDDSPWSSLTFLRLHPFAEKEVFYAAIRGFAIEINVISFSAKLTLWRRCPTHMAQEWQSATTILA